MTIEIEVIVVVLVCAVVPEPKRSKSFREIMDALPTQHEVAAMYEHLDYIPAGDGTRRLSAHAGMNLGAGDPGTTG